MGIVSKVLFWASVGFMVLGILAVVAGLGNPHAVFGFRGGMIVSTLAVAGFIGSFVARNP